MALKLHLYEELKKCKEKQVAVSIYLLGGQQLSGEIIWIGDDEIELKQSNGRVIILNQYVVAANVL